MQAVVMAAVVKSKRRISMKSRKLIEALAAANIIVQSSLTFAGQHEVQKIAPEQSAQIIVTEPDEGLLPQANSGCGNSGCNNAGCGKK